MLHSLVVLRNDNDNDDDDDDDDDNDNDIDNDNDNNNENHNKIHMLFLPHLIAAVLNHCLDCSHYKI